MPTKIGKSHHPLPAIEDLEALLHSEDSAYLIDPGMRNRVLEEKEERERNLILARKVRKKQRKAKELERSAGRSGQ